MSELTTLTNRVIVITGASRGLGRAMAITLAEQGAVIVATARSTGDTPDSAQDTVQHILAAGGRGLALTVDVRDEAQVRAMVEQVLAHYGRVDVLVNNAGLMIGDIAFDDTSPALWRTILDTNLTGAFLCCHVVVPVMKQQGAGVIVNISSGAAVRAGFLNVPYGVSKAGLDRLTLGLGAELQAAGIACISLSPPVSDTATVRHMYPRRDFSAWAHPPELTAQALNAVLVDNPMQYTGQVLPVREYLQHKGLSPQDG
ncbi:MAG: SDR family NAD(P)-dependent oxidoreductase [Candidatus Competibacteraceae bacterium]